MVHDPDHLLRRYQLLLQISSDLTSTLDLPVLLNRIVQAAADLTNAEAGSILLYDEVKQQLLFESASNLDEPSMRGLVVPVDSIAGWIVNNRQSLIINDTMHDPRHFGGLAQSTQVTTTSLMGVPMVANTKVIGVLETINKLEGQFSQDDMDLLEALGSQAALAIENARLFLQSDLISDLVHELRTPLTSLNTAAQLLTNPRVNDDMRQNIVRVIMSETGRLADMASDFLDLARLESGRAQFQTQVFEFSPLLEECASLMRPKAQERGIYIEMDIPGEQLMLRADRNKVKQIVINLDSNAIKYNQQNGRLVIWAGQVGGNVVLKVSDTGAGIPPESLPHLFKKFYRVPGTERITQGTGLGLSITRRIVEAHGGQISVESHVNQGTTFTVSLPQKLES